MYMMVSRITTDFLSFSEKLLEVDTFLENCDLKRLMQELIGSYIMMEEYFMREMVLKVIYKYSLSWKQQLFWLGLDI